MFLKGVLRQNNTPLPPPNEHKRVRVLRFESRQVEHTGARVRTHIHVLIQNTRCSSSVFRKPFFSGFIDYLKQRKNNNYIRFPGGVNTMKNKKKPRGAGTGAEERARTKFVGGVGICRATER